MFDYDRDGKLDPWEAHATSMGYGVTSAPDGSDGVRADSRPPVAHPSRRVYPRLGCTTWIALLGLGSLALFILFWVVIFIRAAVVS